MALIHIVKNNTSVLLIWNNKDLLWDEIDMLRIFILCGLKYEIREIEFLEIGLLRTFTRNDDLDPIRNFQCILLCKVIIH